MRKPNFIAAKDIVLALISVLAALSLAAAIMVATGCASISDDRKRVVDGGAWYSYSHTDGEGRETTLEAVSSRDAIEGRIEIGPDGQASIDVKAVGPGVTRSLINPVGR